MSHHNCVICMELMEALNEGLFLYPSEVSEGGYGMVEVCLNTQCSVQFSYA